MDKQRAYREHTRRLIITEAQRYEALHNESAYSVMYSGPDVELARELEAFYRGARDKAWEILYNLDKQYLAGECGTDETKAEYGDDAQEAHARIVAQDLRVSNDDWTDCDECDTIDVTVQVNAKLEVRILQHKLALLMTEYEKLKAKYDELVAQHERAIVETETHRSANWEFAKEHMEHTEKYKALEALRNECERENGILREKLGATREALESTAAENGALHKKLELFNAPQNLYTWHATKPTWGTSTPPAIQGKMDIEYNKTIEEIKDLRRQIIKLSDELAEYRDSDGDDDAQDEAIQEERRRHLNRIAQLEREVSDTKKELAHYKDNDDYDDDDDDDGSEELRVTKALYENRIADLEKQIEYFREGDVNFWRSKFSTAKLELEREQAGNKNLIESLRVQVEELQRAAEERLIATYSEEQHDELVKALYNRIDRLHLMIEEQAKEIKQFERANKQLGVERDRLRDIEQKHAAAAFNAQRRVAELTHQVEELKKGV